MLKSPFKFLGFNGHAKTPKPNPQNERKKKGLGKLRKVRHPANTSRVVTDSEGKQSGEHNQNQVRASVSSSACNRIRTMYSPQVHRPSVHNTDAIHPFSPHTQSYDSENNDLSSSISVNPSRNSSGGRAQAPISGDPNRLQTSTPSVRRDSLGGGNSFQTHEWDGDHGGVQDWINIGLDYIPKGIVSAIMAPERSTPSNVDPHQHEPEAQEHHDENDNLKKASPIVSQADPLEEENRGRKENVSKHDRESRNVRRIKL
jgi:hypothetical protein